MSTNSQMNWSELVDEITKKAHQDPAFKKELLTDTKRAVEGVLGVKLPDDINIQIHANTTDTIHMVLPLDLSSLEISENILGSIAAGGGGVSGMVNNAKELLNTIKAKKEEQAFENQVKQWQSKYSPGTVATLVSANYPGKK